MDERFDLIVGAVKDKLEPETLDDFTDILTRRKDLLEDLLADRKPFHHIYIWKGTAGDGFDDPESKVEEKEVNPLDELSDSDEEKGKDDAEENEKGAPQHEADTEDERAPKRTSPNLLRLEVDQVSGNINPLDVCVVAIARLRPGFVPLTNSESPEVPKIEDFIRVEKFGDDIFEKLWQRTRIPQQFLPAQGSFEAQNLSNFDRMIQRHSEKVISQELAVDREQCRFLFAVPFDSNTALIGEEAFVLRQLCQSWLRAIDEFLKRQDEDSFFDSTSTAEAKKVEKAAEQREEAEELAEKHTPATVIEQEYVWWKKRKEDVNEMLHKFRLPLVNRALALLAKSDTGLAESFQERLRSLDMILEEAHDNTTFLDTINRHMGVCLNETSVEAITTTLNKLTQTLRSAWMLSKHYNTDKKIVGLLQKITDLLLEKVRRNVDHGSLSTGNVRVQNESARSSMALLTEWHAVFHATKLDIEKSGREARWEFSVKEIFDQVENFRKTCSDVVEVTAVIIKLRQYFSDHLRKATKKVDFVDGAAKRLEELAKSFQSLGFDIFSTKEKHHWENHLNWFHREIKFLEINALGEIDEVFDSLVDAKASICAVDKVLTGGHKTTLRDAVVRNLPKVLSKFMDEVRRSGSCFDDNKQRPPKMPGMPPISGSISWAKDIIDQLDETLGLMSSVEGVENEVLWVDAQRQCADLRARLLNYQQSRYNDWCMKVSDILSQNLTRTLLVSTEKVEGDPEARFKRYTVNFTSDLSDTLAEVKYLESQGFTVPEVARNMSIQEAKFIGIANDLRRMTEKYECTLQLLEDAEMELMKKEIGDLQEVLWPGEHRITWNNLGIEEYLAASNNQLSVLRAKIQQINLVRKELVAYIEDVGLIQLFGYTIQRKMILLIVTYGTNRISETAWGKKEGPRLISMLSFRDSPQISETTTSGSTTLPRSLPRGFSRSRKFCSTLER